MNVIIRCKLSEVGEAEAVASNITHDVSIEITDGPHISFCERCGRGLVIEAERTMKKDGKYYHEECLA